METSKTPHTRLVGMTIVAALFAVCSPAVADTAQITVQVDPPGVQVSSNLFGIFFEEINHAGDGGLYAELVRNRAFEEPGRTNGWQLVSSGTAAGSFAAATSMPLHTNSPTSARVTFASGTGSVGVANNGYWGMNFQAGQTYDLTIYARCTNGFAGSLTARLENAGGTQVHAQGTISGLTSNWQRFSLALVPNATNPTGRLAIAISQPGTVWLDAVSLFPRATFRGRTNGLRTDLANMLTNLAPAFVRFPGGCFVEGDYLTNAFRWKKTVGDIAVRPGHWNAIWNYFSSDGLGYHEYLQMCEDLGAGPLFVINCGMAHNEVVSLPQMGEYVQDALDAIEYANGPTNSTWGAQRAANGHPAPFNLKYFQIGNENGGTAYNDRYALFYDAITNQYPDMHIIACNWFGLPTSRPVEISDEHYYNNPAFFINNATKYDSYSRSGPKIYVGEYAVTSGSGNGNLAGALGEAAFMTGLERNADIVVMSSYAPLFAHANGKDWNPDLVYFDSSRMVATPSYHVQQMFAQNRGDVVLPVVLTVTSASGTNQLPHGAVGVGSWSTQVQFTNVVVTSNGVTIYQSDFSSGPPGWTVYDGTWSTTNGLYQQTAITTDCRSTTGDTNWNSYTLTLRARKTGGSEGFLILFNWLDDNNWTWWNLGGWNNAQHGIEWCVNGSKSDLGSHVSGSIQTNQWYDIRIELNGLNVRCYLDNELIHNVNYPDNTYKGAIGLGTWSTRASFTNVVVTNLTGTLYQSDFPSGTSEWQVYRGTWSPSGGLYRQTSLLTDCRSTTGDTNWSNCTLTLRARKDSGSEGFLILFNRLDDNNWSWWNIGGWNNSQHAIEVCENGSKSILGSAVTGSVQTNRWYDIRIVLAGPRIQCYLDDVLIHDVSYPASGSLAASASYAEARGQIILKTVNVTGDDIPTTLSLAGLAAVVPEASVTVLTSTSATDENTLDQPDRVAPAAATITNAATNFLHTFPANSLTVMRLQLPPALPTLIGLGVATNQVDSSAASNGVPVQLSSFITNSVSVNYVVEIPAGVLTTGTLQFMPGDLVKYIPLPLAALQPGVLLRVTLSDPINGQLDGFTRVYLVQTPAPDDPLRLDIARFADENLVFWADATSRLQQAGTVTGSWSDVTNAASPYRFDFDNDSQFYRLAR